MFFPDLHLVPPRTIKGFCNLDIDVPDDYVYGSGNVLTNKAAFVYIKNKHQVQVDSNKLYIIWKTGANFHSSVYFPKGFMYRFEEAKRKGRFTYIFLSLRHTTSNNEYIVHANFLLYDNEQKTIELFEPHGDSFEMYEVDKFERWIYNTFKDVRYIRTFTPFQTHTEGFENVRRHMGFCLIWSYAYLDLRLTFPDEDSNVLKNELWNELMRTSFTTFIIKYAYYLESLVNYIINLYEDEYNLLLLSHNEFDASMKLLDYVERSET